MVIVAPQSGRMTTAVPLHVRSGSLIMITKSGWRHFEKMAAMRNLTVEVPCPTCEALLEVDLGRDQWVERPEIEDIRGCEHADAVWRSLADISGERFWIRAMEAFEERMATLYDDEMERRIDQERERNG